MSPLTGTAPLTHSAIPCGACCTGLTEKRCHGRQVSTGAPTSTAMVAAADRRRLSHDEAPLFWQADALCGDP